MICLQFKRNEKVKDHELNWPAIWTKFGAYPTEELAEARAEQMQAQTNKWVFRIKTDSPSAQPGR